jgi:hypothetical protein
MFLECLRPIGKELDLQNDQDKTLAKRFVHDPIYKDKRVPPPVGIQTFRMLSRLARCPNPVLIPTTTSAFRPPVSLAFASLNSGWKPEARAAASSISSAAIFFFCSLTGAVQRTNLIQRSVRSPPERCTVPSFKHWGGDRSLLAQCLVV